MDDGADQPTQITDPRSLATTYTLDGLGNLTRVASPDTGIASGAFDKAGNLVSQINARGVTASFTYDPLNRITRATYTPPGSSTTTAVSIVYTYDQGPYALGRLSGISDPNGSISYGYEIHGRVVRDIRTLAGVSYATIYSYDQAGRLTRIVYPSGRTVDYSLDALGRIKQIDTSYGGVIQSVVGNVAYQPFGPVTSFAYGNAQRVSSKFDLDGRIASFTLGTQTRLVTYDADSRITAFKHIDPTFDQSFVYAKNFNGVGHWVGHD